MAKTFEQSDAIRDYVFPIVPLVEESGEYHLKKFLGTGFLIGNRGFALTARHVVHDYGIGDIAAIFARGKKWTWFKIIEIEEHPEEDVALIKLSGNTWKSFFRLSNTIENASKEYSLFGYPGDAAYEFNKDGTIGFGAPDLVYNKGYIRRRLSKGLSIKGIQGHSFFELSELAGTGCSGSPIFFVSRPPNWDVIGIYVGERYYQRINVSYAVRQEAFSGWVPGILGCSVLEESGNTSKIY